VRIATSPKAASMAKITTVVCVSISYLIVKGYVKVLGKKYPKIFVIDFSDLID
jgi:hypothetical protein